MENDSSARKYYVADWLRNAILDYYTQHGYTNTEEKIKECNSFLYKKFPQVSQRTLRQATQAIRSGNYHSKLVQPHYTAMPTFGIVPARFSRYNEYISRMRHLIDQCKRDRRKIRVANIQDGHREHADPVMLDLVLSVLQDFDPDYVPMMCDMVDNTLFQDYTHGTSYKQAGVDPNGGDVEDSPMSKAMIAFETGTLDWADAVNSVTRREVIKPTWLGNHEVWILRYLHENAHSAGYFFNSFFPKLYEAGVLWTEGDLKLELPITDNVIAVHGWTSRSGNYGATANGYLKHYDGNLSVFAGHSHRQETVWSKPHPYTSGQNFVNITGTLGTTRPGYMQQRYTGHVNGFSLAYLSPEGNIGHEVIDVRITRVGDYYECNVMGKTYRSSRASYQEPANPFHKALDNRYVQW